MIKHYLLLLCILALAVCAGASQIQLTNDPGTDQNPFLLKGRDGNIYLFWESDRGGNLGIYWKKCVNGEWSETMTIISDSLQNFSPKAVMDSHGDIWLCFCTYSPLNRSTSWVKVFKYDTEWSFQYEMGPVNYEPFGSNTIAIDAFDDIYVTGHRVYSTTSLMIRKKNDLWGPVEFDASSRIQSNPQLIIPSTTNLPWLIYFYSQSQHGAHYCHTYADYLTESGEWQQIHINWPNYWPFTNEYDAKFYSTVADSMGQIYMGHYNQLDWSMEIDTRYKHYIVRQFNCATAEETGNWVLNLVERTPTTSGKYTSGSGPWDYMDLCADDSKVGYTIYNTEEKQMYARKFDGTNWTIPQPVPGVDEYFTGVNLNYSTILTGNQIMICAPLKINNNKDLYLSKFELNNTIDKTIKPLDYYKMMDYSNGWDVNGYALRQNYPNPFNSSTSFNYNLSKPGRVNISIYNTLGQRVAMLVDGYQADLNGSVQWQGLDDDGQRVSSGIYFARMNAGGVTKTIKMALVE